jgi:hypothetical protein
MAFGNCCASCGSAIGLQVRLLMKDVPEINILICDTCQTTLEERHSRRVREGLERARSQGKAPGNPIGGHIFTHDARQRGGLKAGKARTERTKAHAEQISPVIAELREAGVFSLSGLARNLTTRNVRTASGGTIWTPTMVRRVLERLQKQG